MPQITFSTGNREKFDIAAAACAPLGLELVQNTFDIDEIQGEDPEVIIRDKAQKAYELVGGPVVVSDDSWNIPALNGFPGAYMKSIDHWFRPEDFLNLTRSLEDRRVILIQMLAYQDSGHYQVFRMEHVGELLHEARGNGKSAQQIIAMPSDGGLSIAEAFEQGVSLADREYAAGWRELVNWHQQNIHQTV